MQIISKRLNGDPLPWLLETDTENPSVRYFALRDLLGRPEGDPEVQGARTDIMTSGPVPVILDAQHPAGYCGTLCGCLPSTSTVAVHNA